MMNNKSLAIVIPGAAIFFLIGSGLCPLAVEAKPKRPPQKQETVKEEKAPAAEEAAEEKPAVEEKTGAEAAAVKDGGNQEATEGLPTRDFKEEEFKPQVEEESSAWMFFKMLLILGIFGGGMYYFYRFVSKKTGISMFGGEAVRVLSVIPIGQNKFLQLIDVAGRVLLVGVSDSNINLITEITEKDQIDRIRILSNRTPPPDRGAGGFQDQVMKEIGRIIGRVREYRSRDRRGTTPAEPTQDIEYLRRQRSRLKDLNGDGHE
ncbi:MAG TPA: flagellar biosynthetic protein FliO [Spirochaetota bacterium]|nr:flagellar biosynthetic protein FliO [Spirochaetota bacterium]HOD13879.1 flagellar biosynthetic protein FliO [Spirochaetota bacterium]HPG51699.1 flagellar biosynthetic protein FliO [Spirochaetota bacterium]HPN12327.1 flagellar biosynthetic protein FliO [Spirochaetota bacterium]